MHQVLHELHQGARSQGAPGGALDDEDLIPNELESKNKELMVTADAATEQPFDTFWDNYPRKVGKAASRKTWARAIKRAPASVVIAGCRQMAADPNLPTDKTFIPHLATWLNRDG